MITNLKIAPQQALLDKWNDLPWQAEETSFSAEYSLYPITAQYENYSAYLIQSATGEALDLFLRDYRGVSPVNSFLNASDVSGGFIKMSLKPESNKSALVHHDFHTCAALAKLTGRQVLCSIYPENNRSVAQALYLNDADMRVIVFEDDARYFEGRRYQVIELPKQGALLKKINLHPDQVLEKIRTAEDIELNPEKQSESEEGNEVIVNATSISPEALVRKILSSLKKCVSLDDDSALVWTMYSFFTYLTKSFYHAPILNLTSPVKRCGKSTLLKMCQHLFFDPTLVKGITKASLELIASSKGTPLIDEFDEVQRNSPGVIGVLNGGIEEGAKVTLIGKDGSIRTRETFGAKVLAGIGGLPPTLHDRAVLVRMRRKHESEILTKPHELKDTLAYLKREISQWCEANSALIEATKVDPLEVNNDRFRDNYEPLLKIASCISKELEDKVRAAAVSLVTSQFEEDIGGERLLADIKAGFEARNKKEVGTSELISWLCSHEDSVWRKYKNNTMLTPVDLAKSLATFAIRPIRIRSGTQMRGYKREQFDDAFMRYVPQTHQSEHE